MALSAFFLPASPGQRFCVLHSAITAHRLGAVIYIHPFAEEMNKSRRMASLQSRALAAAGYDVLQVDLHGCGDSSGDFSDATWQGWVDDVLRACRWLQAQTTGALWLWGLRAGCLVAAEAARQIDGPVNLLFWHPPVNGKNLLQQFLRLQVAGELITGASKGTMEALRGKIASGLPVEIAGYTLGSALAGGLEQATLSLPPTTHRVEWLEISGRAEASLAPISVKYLESLQAQGIKVASRMVHGPAFWQTTEIEESPALIEATLNSLKAPGQ